MAEALACLPSDRTPRKNDWANLSKRWKSRLDQQIDALVELRDDLTGCIGCGCLSLKTCSLFNPDDAAAKLGSGPRYLLGDSSEDVL